MKGYTYEALNDHVYRILDGFGVGMYLVVGSRRACLLDTGCGQAGLRALVETLTDRPVFVLLTHGHVDHALGIYEFEEVYMDPRDKELYAQHSGWEYRSLFFQASGVNVPEGALQPVRSMEFRPVKDGQVFDLGGVQVQAFSLPGHTQGSMVYLLREDRMILLGDACGPGTLLLADHSTTLSQYLQGLRHVKEHEAEYDRVLRNHGTCESPKELLDNVIDTCERVLRGEDDRELLPPEMSAALFPENRLRPQPCYSAKRMVAGPAGPVPADGREGNINYRADKVR